jgi:hypothetical protein
LSSFSPEVHVPEAAAVRADLVREDDAAVVVLPDPAELELEVDEADADAGEQAAHEVVHAHRQSAMSSSPPGSPAEAGDMLFRRSSDRRARRLVIIFDDRSGELRSLPRSEPLRRLPARRCAPPPRRHDLDLTDELLAHVEAADEVGRDADLAEQVKICSECGC